MEMTGQLEQIPGTPWIRRLDGFKNRYGRDYY